MVPCLCTRSIFIETVSGGSLAYERLLCSTLHHRFRMYNKISIRAARNKKEPASLSSMIGLRWLGNRNVMIKKMSVCAQGLHLI